MTTIFSWNVNGIRAMEKKGFIDWLAEAQPDILCLQETKALPTDLSDKLRAPDGYASAWQSAERKGYSGTATYYRRNLEPLSAGVLGKKEFDSEGRVQVLEYSDFHLINCYFPNSQAERARLDYKLKFVDAVKRYANKLRKAGKNTIICGDYNIAHTEIDLARPKQNEDNPGYYIEERESMTKFLKAGYVDTFRHFCPEPGHYSWWSYRAGARARNVGWRLDYHCVNKEFIGQVKGAAILSDVMGSDHCPVTIEVK
jgi:exodeoxyribonuclease-3